MSNSLNKFQDKLSDREYKRLFSLLLTDRGTEFAKPQQFEIIDIIYGQDLADKINILLTSSQIAFTFTELLLLFLLDVLIRDY